MGVAHNDFLYVVVVLLFCIINQVHGGSTVLVREKIEKPAVLMSQPLRYPQQIVKLIDDSFGYVRVYGTTIIALQDTESISIIIFNRDGTSTAGYVTPYARISLNAKFDGQKLNDMEVIHHKNATTGAIQHYLIVSNEFNSTTTKLIKFEFIENQLNGFTVHRRGETFINILGKMVFHSHPEVPIIRIISSVDVNNSDSSYADVNFNSMAILSVKDVAKSVFLYPIIWTSDSIVTGNKTRSVSCVFDINSTAASLCCYSMEQQDPSVPSDIPVSPTLVGCHTYGGLIRAAEPIFFYSQATNSLVVFHSPSIFHFLLDTDFKMQQVQTWDTKLSFASGGDVQVDLTKDDMGLILAHSVNSTHCGIMYYDLLSMNISAADSLVVPCRPWVNEFATESFTSIVAVGGKLDFFAVSNTKYDATFESDLVLMEFRYGELTYAYSQPFGQLLIDRVSSASLISSRSESDAKFLMISLPLFSKPYSRNIHRAWTVSIDTEDGSFIYDHEFYHRVESGYITGYNVELYVPRTSKNYVLFLDYALLDGSAQACDSRGGFSTVKGLLISYDDNNGWETVMSYKNIPVVDCSYFAISSSKREDFSILSRCQTYICDVLTISTNTSMKQNELVTLFAKSQNETYFLQLRSFRGYLDTDQQFGLFQSLIIAPTEGIALVVVDVINWKIISVIETPLSQEDFVSGIFIKGAHVYIMSDYVNDSVKMIQYPFVWNRKTASYEIKSNFKSFELNTKSLYRPGLGTQTAAISSFSDHPENPSFIYLSCVVDGGTSSETIIYQIDVRDDRPGVVNVFSPGNSPGQYPFSAIFINRNRRANNGGDRVLFLNTNLFAIKERSRVALVQLYEPVVDKSRLITLVTILPILSCFILFAGIIITVLLIKKWRIERKYKDIKAKWIDSYSPEYSTKKWVIDFTDLVLEKEIGKGASGVVYRGKWGHSTVAIKKIVNAASSSSLVATSQSDRSTAPEHSQSNHQSFIEEAHTLVQMRHMSILLFLGICIHQEQRYIVTEYLEKGQLDNYLKGKFELDLEEKVQILKEVAEGMVYLHSRKPSIIHRDLKPQNILLDQFMRPKIVDFGLSESKSSFASGLVGTPPYCAPEVLAQDSSQSSLQYSASCDVYSFAIIMYQVLTEIVPYGMVFWGDRVMQAKVIQGERPNVPFLVSHKGAATDEIELKDLSSNSRSDNLSDLGIQFDETILEKWCRDRKYLKKNYTTVIKKYATLMVHCWQADPEKRPNFSEVHDSIEEMYQLVIQ